MLLFYCFATIFHKLQVARMIYDRMERIHCGVQRSADNINYFLFFIISANYILFWYRWRFPESPVCINHLMSVSLVAPGSFPFDFEISDLIMNLILIRTRVEFIVWNFYMYYKYVAFYKIETICRYEMLNNWIFYFNL